MKKSANLFRTVALVAALALPASAAIAAAAEGDLVGRTAAEITENLEQQGYEVLEILKDDGNLVASVVLEGKPGVISTDPQTGEIVAIAMEDGDDDENRFVAFLKRLVGRDD